MDHLHIDGNPQRSKQSNCLILSLRLLGGAIFGYVISFLLLLWSETGHSSLLWWVFWGQEELFHQAFFFTLYDKWHTMDLGQVHYTAIFVYASLWAFIVILLVSGKRRLNRLGIIFLILYVLTGFLFYVVLVARSVAH